MSFKVCADVKKQRVLWCPIHSGFSTFPTAKKVHPCKRTLRSFQFSEDKRFFVYYTNTFNSLPPPDTVRAFPWVTKLPFQVGWVSFPNQSLTNFEPLILNKLWGFIPSDATARCSLLESDTNSARCGKHAATKEIVSLATRKHWQHRTRNPLQPHCPGWLFLDSGCPLQLHKADVEAQIVLPSPSGKEELMNHHLQRPNFGV